MFNILQTDPNKYAVWIEAIKTIGPILIAIIGVWNLVVTRKVHVLTNSGMTAMKLQVAELQTQLGSSRENAATAAAIAGQPQPLGAAEAATVHAQEAPPAV